MFGSKNSVYVAIAKSKNRFFFNAVKNFNCRCFKCFSILKIRASRNLFLNLAVSICQKVLFSFFVFFIGLFSFGLIYIDLVASYCVIRGSKKVRLCAYALRLKGT